MLNYPKVELDFMNRDHAEFVTMRARLLDELRAPAPGTAVDGLLDGFLQHTRHHFAEEERLMRETRFPPHAMHKGEHERVLTDMETRIGHWKQGRDASALRDWLEQTMGEWFVTHVSTMDFVTAGYIKAQGRN